MEIRTTEQALHDAKGAGAGENINLLSPGVLDASTESAAAREETKALSSPSSKATTFTGLGHTPKAKEAIRDVNGRAAAQITSQLLDSAASEEQKQTLDNLRGPGAFEEQKQDVQDDNPARMFLAFKGAATESPLTSASKATSLTGPGNTLKAKEARGDAGARAAAEEINDLLGPGAFEEQKQTVDADPQAQKLVVSTKGDAAEATSTSAGHPQDAEDAIDNIERRAKAQKDNNLLVSGAFEEQKEALENVPPAQHFPLNTFPQAQKLLVPKVVATEAPSTLTGKATSFSDSGHTQNAEAARSDATGKADAQGKNNLQGARASEEQKQGLTDGPSAQSVPVPKPDVIKAPSSPTNATDGIIRYNDVMDGRLAQNVPEVTSTSSAQEGKSANASVHNDADGAVAQELQAAYQALAQPIQKDARPRTPGLANGLSWAQGRASGGLKPGGVLLETGNDVRRCRSNNSVVVPRRTWPVHSKWAPLADGTYFESVCQVRFLTNSARKKMCSNSTVLPLHFRRPAHVPDLI
jgi:hypothetical protein